MTSTSIYSILSSKPHNPHYLNRYWKFIQYCQTKSNIGYTEEHHICPAAKDMFLEYKSFKTNLWNKVILTLRQHLIAHWMLHKAFGKSQSKAFFMMSNTRDGIKIKSSRLYENLRSTCSKFGAGENNSMYGKTHSQKFKDEKRELILGEKNPNFGKTGELNHNFGKKRKPEDIEKWASKMRGRPSTQIICPHCNKSGGNSIMYRWHFDNCKLRQ